MSLIFNEFQKNIFVLAKTLCLAINYQVGDYLQDGFKTNCIIYSIFP